MGAFLVVLLAAAVGGGVALLVDARAENTVAQDNEVSPALHSADMMYLAAVDGRLIALGNEIPR